MLRPKRCKLPAIAVLWNAGVNSETDDCRRMEVLVVDDDEILRELMCDWLEGAGYRVRKAANCTSACEELTRGAPALIVTDMFMPGPCGGAAISRLKETLPGVAVVAVSGHFGSGQGLSAEAALAAGADRALGKPVKRADLLQAVGELIGR
jgi:CheY-like chemotaxis protein